MEGASQTAAADEPAREVLKPPSFAQVVQNGQSKAQKFFLDGRGTQRSSSNRVIPVKPVTSYKGTVAVRFSTSEVLNLARPLSFALVGKFSHGLPTRIELNKCFLQLGLKGSFTFGYMDKKHILIRLQSEEDYSRLWLRRDWYFQGFPMRVFKWTPKFKPSIESPLAPVWISFPSLPVHFFQMDALDSIASAVGKPLRVDESTANLTRPSAARVCVELDLLGDIPSQIWIGDGDGEDEGFFQPIEYEDIPKYCEYCQHLGHLKSDCLLLTPKDPKKSSAADPVEDVPKIPEGTDLRQILEKKRGKKKMTETQPPISTTRTPGPLIIKDNIASSNKGKGSKEKHTSNIPAKKVQMVPSSDDTCSAEVVPQFCIQLDFPKENPKSPNQQSSQSTSGSNESNQCSTSPPPAAKNHAACQERIEHQDIDRAIAQLPSPQRHLIALKGDPMNTQAQPQLEDADLAQAEDTFGEETEEEEQQFERVKSRRRRSLGTPPALKSPQTAHVTSSSKRITYKRRGKSVSDGNQ